MSQFLSPSFLALLPTSLLSYFSPSYTATKSIPRYNFNTAFTPLTPRYFGLFDSTFILSSSTSLSFSLSPGMAVRPRTATTSTIPDYTTLPTLFCLVRPPPSNSTHPLNLQIQLLVPSIPTQQRNDSNRRSGEYSRSSSRSGSIADDSTAGGGDSRLNVGTPKSTAGVSAISFDAIAGASVSRSGSRASDNEGLGPGGEELSRIPSGGSTRSRGSTNSMSVRSDTASSNGTGTATRRRVTPLLNLSFHSVLPTVVTDAGEHALFPLES